VHFDQVGQRPCLHFLHNSCAVDFHCALTDTELISDDLVRFARYDKVEDFALAIRKSCQSFCHFSVRLPFLATLLVGLERLANAIKQILVAKGFLNEVNGPFLHCIDRHWYVAMARDENDRQGAAAPQQFVLKFQSTESRHTNVENEATGAMVIDALQKLVTGREYFVLDIDRVHQCLHGKADCRVVIDDKNGGLFVLILRHNIRVWLP